MSSLSSQETPKEQMRPLSGGIPFAHAQGKDRRLRPRPPSIASMRRVAHIVPFQNEQKSCSQVLFDLLQIVPADGMSLRGIIHFLGERGLLMSCMIFCLPSMLPIPLPGMSVPQGFLITLIGMGLLFNRAPWLPSSLLEYRISPKNLALMLTKGVHVFARIEKLSYPRLDPLTRSAPMRITNGILLVLGALLLMAPFPIPFSNVLPAYGILFLAFGSLQRDGWLVLAGYCMLVLSLAYIAALLFFGMAWLLSLWR